jgi:hypothetical protein
VPLLARPAVQDFGENSTLPDKPALAQIGDKQKLAILPGRILREIDEPQQRLDPLGFRHPIAAAFRGRSENSLLTTPVFKHWLLELPKDTTAATVLALGNGDPLLVEHSVHRGRVLVMTTSAEIAWSAMPLWPSFVPLVKEIVKRCVAERIRQNNLTVGEPISISQTGATSVPSILQPDGATAAMTPHAADDSTWATFADTWQSGFYTITSSSATTSASEKQVKKIFAVNVATSESDLAPISLDALRNDVWPGISFIHETDWQTAVSSAAGHSPNRSRLHVELLYAALFLLLLEVAVARKAA